MNSQKRSFKDFIVKYPNAFKTSTDPLYPFPMFGFECSEGWIDLLEPVVKWIHEFNTGKPEDEKISITQIKEKYGTLRFYTNFTTDELDKLIREAEDKSEVTCERCGSPGVLRGRGWMYTSCEVHVNEHDKEPLPPLDPSILEGVEEEND